MLGGQLKKRISHSYKRYLKFTALQKHLPLFYLL